MAVQVAVVGARLCIAKVDCGETSRKVWAVLSRAHMWHEAQPVIGVVMDSIVALIDGKAHDEERRLSLQEQEHALGAILLRTDVFHVVLGIYLQPSSVEQEVQVGVCPVAFDVDALTVDISVADSLTDFKEKSIEEWLKDVIRHLDSVRS